jgi:hypothetical protein
MQSLSDHDHQKRYCPMLGHDLTFAYCRAPGNAVPCRKIIDCWWEVFDVESFVKEHFGDTILQTISQPAADKMVTLFDLIQQAKQAQKK